jgi:hypothetical protein
MNTRKLSLAIVTIAAFAPIVASASPEDVALNACAKAFASSISGGSSAPAFKLSYDQKHAADTLGGYYVRSYSFTMQARHSKTGVALASATCSADSHGEVLAFNAASTTESATLAAR